MAEPTGTPTDRDQPPPAETAAPITESDLRGLKHFKALLPLFERLHDVGCERDTAHNRTLHMDEYCAFVVLYLLNPVVKSVRALQNASLLDRVARKLGVRRFSMGSFSEAPAVFEPERLVPIIQELGAQVQKVNPQPGLADVKHALTLVDSTVLSGLPQLAAAAGMDTRYTTGRDGRGVYGWRMHTQFDLETFAPRRVDVRGARNAGPQRENNVLRATLEPERCYVGDGGYADRTLFDDIVDALSSYVVRLREDCQAQVIQERALTAAAKAAGVVRDVIVTLGGPDASATKHPVRLIELKVTPHERRRRAGFASTDRLIIATSLLDLPAELVALVYQSRYTVELFFRVLKSLLGMRHLLSHRGKGVEIQVYCAVIACLLLSLQTGCKPNRRTVEMVGWYLLGLASEEELLAFLNRPDRRGSKLALKDALWQKLGY